LIVTTPAGEAKLGGELPASTRLIVLDSAPIRLGSAVERLRDEGLTLLLTEGGPSVFAQLLEENLVDELFLTVSPRVFGQVPGRGRKSLVHGVELGGTELELSSARRHGSHLFMRYAIGKR
jgi:riboflavin biosynthesis pyrimidine reductase